MKERRDVIFLDRDGVINVYPGDYNYVTSKEDFFFIDGSIEGIKMLKDQGFLLYVVSNQAGISKGVYSQETLDGITAHMEKELQKRGVALDGIFYCPHREGDQCNCRKPKTGLLEKATQGIPLRHCIFIGDSSVDIATGNRFGSTTMLVLSGKENDPDAMSKWEIQPDYIFVNLQAAADFIVGSFVPSFDRVQDSPASGGAGPHETP